MKISVFAFLFAFALSSAVPGQTAPTPAVPTPTVPAPTASAPTVSAPTDEYLILDTRADEFDHWQERLDYTYGTTVISKETNVPVIVLEQQRTQAHLGYGGLMIANALALETGKSFDEIVALKTSSVGWGRIARDNKVDLGRIVSRLDRVEGEFRQAEIKGVSGGADVQSSKEAKSGRASDKQSRGSKTKTKSSVKKASSTKQPKANKAASR